MNISFLSVWIFVFLINIFINIFVIGIHMLVFMKNLKVFFILFYIILEAKDNKTFFEPIIAFWCILGSSSLSFVSRFSFCFFLLFRQGHIFYDNHRRYYRKQEKQKRRIIIASSIQEKQLNWPCHFFPRLHYCLIKSKPNFEFRE